MTILLLLVTLFKENTEKFKSGNRLIFINKRKAKSTYLLMRLTLKKGRLGGHQMCVTEEHQNSDPPKNITSTNLTDT